ncbi:hypothetical protein LTR62_008416 [Meristemomyces frigidus]|uniref:SMP-30/Gluconolactonase/LRE-like region domain-containing protein n=1 Tax=Meristemomyces frigidus TaxID=1508187 RepID=A0AAN7YCP1_9PEZI|nr:hypothetical protein LTR62_008416 [Meristemomyces frigidus]
MADARLSIANLPKKRRDTFGKQHEAIAISAKEVLEVPVMEDLITKIDIRVEPLIRPGKVSKEEMTLTAKALPSKQNPQPGFLAYDDSFLEDVLGSDPKLTMILEKEWKFAHEAPTYIPEQDAVYFTSSPPLLNSGRKDSNIAIFKASRKQDSSWSCEELATNIAMGNGSINYKNGILFCSQGDKTAPGGLVYMQTTAPYATKTLLDGFHGRLFNSVNDVVTHSDGSIWFTDPTYGYEQDFRLKPELPCQVYKFEPETGEVRVVADGFGRPNGLCFSPDEETMYITDTDQIHGDGVDFTRSATIYAFDVLARHNSRFLANRRLFAMADSGVPDGIKVDRKGNVYSGCGDGVNVWNAGGRLIGKIVVPGGVANFCFTKPGEIFMLNEERVWVARVGRGTEGALLWNLGLGRDGRQ